MEDKYIVVVGSLNCDLIFLQERLPERGETYLVDHASVSSGGKGANQAVQAAKLGAKTYMVGKLGKDIWGDFLDNTVSGYGVDTKYVMRSEGITGLAAVHTLRDGVYYSSVAAGTNFEITVEEIKEIKDVIANAAVVVLQLEVPIDVVEKVIEITDAAGVISVLNAAPAAHVKDETLKKLDYLIVNEVEASYYLGKTIYSFENVEENYKELLDKVKRAVIITLGDRGSVLCNGSGVKVFTPSEGIKAIETTGSGDSYVGAFSYMKMMQKSDEEACKFASYVAEYTVTQIGAQEAMPTLKIIENYIKSK